MASILSVLQQIGVALFGGTIGETTYAGVVNTFFEWLTSPDVIVFWLIGVCVSLFLLAVRVVKSIFWGA